MKSPGAPTVPKANHFSIFWPCIGLEIQGVTSPYFWNLPIDICLSQSTLPKQQYVCPHSMFVSSDMKFPPLTKSVPFTHLSLRVAMHSPCNNQTKLE